MKAPRDSGKPAGKYAERGPGFKGPPEGGGRPIPGKPFRTRTYHRTQSATQTEGFDRHAQASEESSGPQPAKRRAAYPARFANDSSRDLPSVERQDLILSLPIPLLRAVENRARGAGIAPSQLVAAWIADRFPQV